MADPYEIEERKKITEKALRENSLSVKGLGELILEKDRLLIKDSNVIELEDKVPIESFENYENYHAIIQELNRREEKYRRRHGLYYDY